MITSLRIDLTMMTPFFICNACRLSRSINMRDRHPGFCLFYVDLAYRVAQDEDRKVCLPYLRDLPRGEFFSANNHERESCSQYQPKRFRYLIWLL